MIQRARRFLQQLENESAAQQSAGRDSRTPQQELAFGPPPPPDPVHELLDALDPDTLTPKQALDALYALKRMKGTGPVGAPLGATGSTGTVE